MEPFLDSSLYSCLNYFSGIITYEDVSKHKPFPDAYQLAVKLSKKSNLNCLAIEDSNIGVDAAKAANIHCLLTLPPWASDLENINNKANACVDRLGNNHISPNVIYGKSLINDYVDLAYLSNIIN